jgi:radical SAM protein with 4Fe4S-binding SPASM domain
MQGIVCGTFLTIYPDGKVLFCDNYNCGEYEELGNIKEKTISQIVGGDRFKFMRDMTKGRLNKCKGCEVITVCNGGCPIDWNEKGSFFCSYYKDFYYSCYEKVLRLLQDASC